MGQIHLMGETTTYADRKRERDKNIATISRQILKDQPTMTRSESYKLATSLYEQDQQYIPINSTTVTSADISLDEPSTDTQALQAARPEQTDLRVVKNVNGVNLTAQRRLYLRGRHSRLLRTLARRYPWRTS